MYQAGKPALLALAAVLLVTATGATAPAASVKLSPAQESAETRFVLFALEDLFRTTWADPQSVGDGRAVRAFIAQRERIVDDLSHRVRDAKLGRDRNTELIEALELYMKSVRDHGEKYAADLDKVIDRDGALKKWVEIHKRVDKEADPTRYVVATQVNAAALDTYGGPTPTPSGCSRRHFWG